MISFNFLNIFNFVSWFLSLKKNHRLLIGKKLLAGIEFTRSTQTKQWKSRFFDLCSSRSVLLRHQRNKSRYSYSFAYKTFFICIFFFYLGIFIIIRQNVGLLFLDYFNYLFHWRKLFLSTNIYFRLV